MGNLCWPCHILIGQGHSKVMICRASIPFWICPKVVQKLESENRFNPLGNSDKTKSSAPSTLTSKSKFIGGLKFFSININSIRGKKLELLAFIDLHEPQIVAIQETKIDSSISSSELFPETFPYSVYRKDRTHSQGYPTHANDRIRK